MSPTGFESRRRRFFLLGPFRLLAIAVPGNQSFLDGASSAVIGGLIPINRGTCLRDGSGGAPVFQKLLGLNAANNAEREEETYHFVTVPWATCFFAVVQPASFAYYVLTGQGKTLFGLIFQGCLLSPASTGRLKLPTSGCPLFHMTRLAWLRGRAKRGPQSSWTTQNRKLLQQPMLAVK